jgi:hypothetical protein
MKKKIKPIQYSFEIWMNNYPESYHPLDMKRFYRFVHTVKRYSRKPITEGWLRDEILKYQKTHKNKLDDDKINYYCSLFRDLIDFCDSYSYSSTIYIDDNDQPL